MPITCTKCWTYKKVRAKYVCRSTICGTRTWYDGPKPDGVPYSQPCPGCGQPTSYTSYTCTNCAPQA